MKGRMLSIATTSSKRHQSRRRRTTEAGAVRPEPAKSRHLKAVEGEEAEPEATETPELELGAENASPMTDLVGLPIEAGPEIEAPAAVEAEPVPSDYSTIGAYLHELRRYPLMTRAEEHEVAVRDAQ